MSDHERPEASSVATSHSSGVEKHAGVSETILLALYSENGAIVRTMVEWRHKLILLYVLALGALVTSGVWLQEHNMRVTLRWELVAGGLIMCLFTLMEHRTTAILHACYRIGTDIEATLTKTTVSATYSELHISGQQMRFTYSNLLQLTYAATAAALLIAALFIS